MKTKIENLSGCRRRLNIEVSAQELEQQFEQVYTDIGKVVRVPGFRPGKAPRDLLKVHYSKRAEEEVINRAIPKFYIQAVEQEKLTPLVSPEIVNVQFKDHTLSFSAEVDVQPQVKIKSYKELRIEKKVIQIESSQIDDTLARLRQSQAEAGKKEAIAPNPLPELNDKFAQGLGLSSLAELKQSIRKGLMDNAQNQINADMRRQVFERLLQRASLDAPQSLVTRQMQELQNQLKLNQTLMKKNKQAIDPPEKELEEQVRKEAVRRVKLSFILQAIAQKEAIQVTGQDLTERIKLIAQQSAKSEQEIKQYFEQQNLIPSLEAELREQKTIEFLIKAAKIEKG